MVSAAHGRFDVVLRNMNDREAEHYLAWAQPYHEMVHAQTGFGLRFSHLWHGDIDNRRYRERHDGLTRYGFDPFVDIAQTGDGIWRWNTAKPDLHGG